MSNDHVSNLMKGHMESLAAEGKRADGRGIRESRMIDFEALCIEEGERVWMVYIDLHILDNDGNLSIVVL